jgi:hypothetical protein
LKKKPAARVGVCIRRKAQQEEESDKKHDIKTSQEENSLRIRDLSILGTYGCICQGIIVIINFPQLH